MCLTSNNFVETTYFDALASFFAAVLYHLYQSCFSRIMCNLLQILHETNRKRYARRLFDRPGIATRYSVGPYVISCQMFVKSEFPLDSALVCDSDQKKLRWHFFRKL